MTGDADWWRMLPASVRRLPADLAAVLVAVVLTVVAVFLPVVSETPVRVVVGLPFVLFIPGYAFIAALFPEAGESATDVESDEEDAEDVDVDEATTDWSGIDGIERVALSFGLSIAIVPLIGLVLNFTPWGIRLVPVMISVSLFTLGSTVVAARRRLALDPEEQFVVPWREWLHDARTGLFEPETRTDGALNVLLTASVILAVGSVGYAVAVPNEGEAFTEFYILTETDDGELVADDYPTNFTQGESRSLVVGVGNEEHQPMNYTVVVALQEVRVQNNSTTVTEEAELRRFQTQVAYNETWHLQHNVTPTMAGERLRLAYLLYKGEPPASPTVENSYREVHLWVNVTAPES